MNIFDKNQTLQPPEGEAQYATPIGSYLTLQYRDWDKGIITVVYLNDQGREVLRTVTDTAPRSSIEEENAMLKQQISYMQELIAEAIKVPEPKPPVGRRHRLAAGFWLMLEGIMEMSKCLRP